MKKLYGAYAPATYRKSVFHVLQDVSHCRAALGRRFPTAKLAEVKPAGKGSFMLKNSGEFVTVKA